MNLSGVLALCLSLIVLVSTASISQRSISPHAENLYYNHLQKRPFCNAFTGCGRKRSDPLLSQEQVMEDFEPYLLGRLQKRSDEPYGHEDLYGYI
ncbi:cardioactive peptide [Lepeophtheirus salmonis]|nr:cardioactive peptide-like [Lepeophtheirus salmonis]